MRTPIGVLAGIVLLLGVQNASAASESARIQVSVQVVPNCKILVSDLAFGSYDPLMNHATGALDATANLRVLCTKSLRANVLMTDSGSRERLMRNGSDQLAYAVFSDPARTKVWAAGADAVQIIGNGATPQEMTIFGRVPAGQIVPAGWYTDAVTATVDF